jgi:hypothetical protein
VTRSSRDNLRLSVFRVGANIHSSQSTITYGQTDANDSDQVNVKLEPQMMSQIHPCRPLAYGIGRTGLDTEHSRSLSCGAMPAEDSHV